MTWGERWVAWFLEHRLITAIVVLGVVFAGLVVSPFDAHIPGLPRAPIPVDAIPDMGDNQQIVMTQWPGRSPKDVEDQITYPLTVALSSLSGVQTVRSTSMFGVSNLYIIFDDSAGFYDSRTRILERLASLPRDALPDGVTPTLGPDATGLGQIYAYTLEGHDADGGLVGGWDLDELRSIQDFYVKPMLQAVNGVAEVASVGGFVRELQVDVDPEALRAHGVVLSDVARAVREANQAVGARTLEINHVEYILRSTGYVRSLRDVELAAIQSRDDTPLRVRDVAQVQWGPALRRGALDDAGAPAVGGTVVARFGADPAQVIAGIEEALQKLSGSLPTRTLEDHTISRVTVVPYYDRSTLISETLSTLSSALLQQLLISLAVVLVMMRNTRSGLIVAAMLPLGVLATFIGMKTLGVQANLMALAGIAIAIGTMVDVGVLYVEAIEREIEPGQSFQERMDSARRAAGRILPAIFTSVATTVVSFLPVFGLVAGDLRLFGPLAATKTLAMVAAAVLGAIALPITAAWLLRTVRGPFSRVPVWLFGAIVAVIALAVLWSPFGPRWALNLLFVGAITGSVLALFLAFEIAYPALLRLALTHKGTFAVLPVGAVIAGGIAFTQLQSEHLPAFDEGAFLYMPTTTAHASFGEALRLLSESDAAIASVPEVDRVVGKIGRAETALDPAPISMIETVVTLKDEYGVDSEGRRVRQWRDTIRTSRDIWDEILRAADRPGLTSAPWLMPIGARLVMLQSGMRSPYGLKVQGPDLAAIEAFAIAVEPILRGVSSVDPQTVFADRVVGKPYLEIDLNREEIGRLGLSVFAVQDALEVALGGRTLTRTVQGRERYPVRVRVAREDRDTVEAIDRLAIPTPDGRSVPLGQLATLQYARGPQMIRAEDSFSTTYVLFDAAQGFASGTVVPAAERAIKDAIAAGTLNVPDGVTWRFAGTFENQVKTEERLKLLVPLALGLVIILLHLQFRDLLTTAAIGAGLVVAASGGMIALWLYGQPWFLDLPLVGTDLRETFRVGPVNLSLAVWVGFIALLGLATDDGVVISTYLRDRLRADPPKTVDDVRSRVMEAGQRRIRACLMTTATTLLALLPVLSSSGRGGDWMMPMALPAVGGMTLAILTLFVVPVTSCAIEERRLRT
jgi:Cu(I)/Ag(I) efflux system membrane protein CusA/SilA